MKFAFFIGTFVVLLFNLFRFLDLYVVSSIGIWNFTYAGPFLFTNTSSGNIFLNLSLLLLIIARKRAAIVAMLVVIFWLITIVSKKKK